MPAPIVVGQQRNPFENLLMNLYLGKIEHNYKMDLMDKQLEHDKLALEEKRTYQEGREKLKEKSALLRAGFTETGSENGAKYDPIAEGWFKPKPEKPKTITTANGIFELFNKNGRLEVGKRLGDKPSTTEFDLLKREIAGDKQATAMLDARSKRKINEYQQGRKAFQGVSTSTPGIIFDRLEKQFYKRDPSGNLVQLNSEEVRKQALKYKEELPTNDIRVMQQSVPSVKRLIGQSLEALKKTNVGPLAGRWKDLWSSKVGAKDKNFRKLKTDINLLQTRLMKMHVGARGGEYIMKHFETILNAGKDSPENMLAALQEINSYADEVGLPLPQQKKWATSKKLNFNLNDDPLGIR